MIAPSNIGRLILVGVHFVKSQPKTALPDRLAERSQRAPNSQTPKWIFGQKADESSSSNVSAAPAFCNSAPSLGRATRNLIDRPMKVQVRQ